MVLSLPLPDLLLWSSFKEGDEIAFETIYKKYYPVLINYGHKFTTDLFILEESIQDLFVILWNHRFTLGEPVSVKNYLFKAFRNILLRKIQKSRAIQPHEIDEDSSQFHFELSADQEIMQSERLMEIKILLDKALLLLTNRQREAVYLRFYEEMPYEQVSEVLNMNVTGTYKLIYRALDRLKDELGPSLFTMLMVYLNQGAKISL